MRAKNAWTLLALTALATIQTGRFALADEVGCLVVGAWDEARGEPAPVIEAVVSTIVNRARVRGLSICDAVMDPAALTGVTPAMHELFSEAAKPRNEISPQPHTRTDREQLALIQTAAAAAVAGTLIDRSNGATNFYSPAGMREMGLPAEPRWAAAMQETATVGPFVFLREKGSFPRRKETVTLAQNQHPLLNSQPLTAASPDIDRSVVPYPADAFLEPDARDPKLPAPPDQQDGPAQTVFSTQAAPALDPQPQIGPVADIPSEDPLPLPPTFDPRQVRKASVKAAETAPEPIRMLDLQTLPPMTPPRVRPLLPLKAPVEMATVVLDTPHNLELPGTHQPHFSIVAEAAAEELPPQSAYAGRTARPDDREGQAQPYDSGVPTDQPDTRQQVTESDTPRSDSAQPSQRATEAAPTQLFATSDRGNADEPPAEQGGNDAYDTEPTQYAAREPQRYDASDPQQYAAPAPPRYAAPEWRYWNPPPPRAAMFQPQPAYWQARQWTWVACRGWGHRVVYVAVDWRRARTASACGY